MSATAQAWMDAHPITVGLLRRCWDRDPAYRDPHGNLRYIRDTATPDPADLTALHAWVTHTVLTSPLPTPWDDWPARFAQTDPNRPLTSWERV